MPKHRDVSSCDTKQGVSRRKWMLDVGTGLLVTPGIARAGARTGTEVTLPPASFDPRSVWITDLTVSRPDRKSVV